MFRLIIHAWPRERLIKINDYFLFEIDAVASSGSRHQEKNNNNNSGSRLCPHNDEFEIWLI